MYRQLGQAREQLAYLEVIRECRGQLAQADQTLRALKDRVDSASTNASIGNLERTVHSLAATVNTLDERVRKMDLDNQTWRARFSSQYMKQLQAQRVVGPLPPANTGSASTS